MKAVTNFRLDASLVAAVAVLLATWSVSVAEAQSCGAPSTSSSSSSDDSSSDDSNTGGSSSSDDDGFSSSGSDGGWWSGSDDDDGESSGSTICQSTSDVTGLDECRQFGDGWNAIWPALRFELGASVRRLSLEGMTLANTAYHDGNPYRFSLEAADLADPAVILGGIDLRVTSMIGRYVLLGAELNAGFGGSPEGEVEHDGQVLSAGGVSTVGGGVVAGLVLPVGPVRLRGELVAGGQGVIVSTTSTLGDCISQQSEVHARWVIESRVGVEVFIGPSVSLDLWGGADVLNGGSMAGGLRLNFHARTYDAIAP